MSIRTATVERKTAETSVKLILNLDGNGHGVIDSGIGFFDHMLNLMTAHGLMDLTLACDGDIDVDGHHSVEDIGITLGQAFKQAIGAKKGIRRYGTFYLPMDEAGEQEVRHSRRLDALARITSYMREHYQEELKLTEVANMFGYSDAYLSRMFQKYANVNFKTYLQDIRMTYAYRELLNSDKTISQIAMDNGFSSSRAFTREFQKRYGILPSEVEREK